MKLDKVMVILALLLVFVTLLTPVALAQNDNPPAQIPDTAKQAVEQAAVILALFAGVVASYVTDWIKKIPYLAGPDKEKLGGAVAELIIIVVSIGAGYLTTFLNQYAGQVDNSGLWRMIQMFLPLVVAEARFQLVKYRKIQEQASF